ncbi:hypothetical protein [Leclercia sp.]|uniref:hypothetical protein n=1 Tax=Leclercia sp. TaxID=1898428 RepID=UPI0028B184BA|nr:hypothetical protein [Leclercia sp.]
MTTEEKSEWIRQLKNSVDDLSSYLTITPLPKDAIDIRWRLEVEKMALAFLTDEPAAFPDGWRLVPVEPTVEMINAAQSSTAWDKVEFWDGFYDDKAAYQAMLAAAAAP